MAAVLQVSSLAAGMLRGLMRVNDPPLFGAGSGVVMLAHDTRPSAEELIKAAGSGVKALGGLPIVCGLLTTPQLHWMVRHSGSSQFTLRYEPLLFSFPQGVLT